MISSINYAAIDTLWLLHLPPDPNLIGTFHYYNPFEFTHQGAAWVDESAILVGTTWEGTTSEKAAVRDSFDCVMIWSHQVQTSILMGEFGVINKADPASRCRWISFVAQEAEECGISWLYWRFCSEMGVYNCDTSSWDQNHLNALVQP